MMPLDLLRPLTVCAAVAMGVRVHGRLLRPAVRDEPAPAAVARLLRTGAGIAFLPMLIAGILTPLTARLAGRFGRHVYQYSLGFNSPSNVNHRVDTQIIS
jgi:hypothetical protein